jgi:hypothetical protein
LDQQQQPSDNWFGAAHGGEGDSMNELILLAGRQDSNLQPDRYEREDIDQAR